MLALTSTSTFGTVYDARPRKDVAQASVTSHESTRDEPRSSGSAFVTEQLSRTARPVLVPPCTVRPIGNRAVTLKSTPCQYDVRAEPYFVSAVMKFWAPFALAAGVMATKVAVPPPPGRLSCCGIVRLYCS